MSRFANSALALVISFCASTAAHAQFPSCDPTVSNPELNPPYPSDPAIPYSGSHHTKWTVDKLAINLSIDNAAPTQFYINGVNYEPTQIGGSADFSPFNDFFYTNNVQTWNPLWPRDIPLLRAMGVNAIRTYGMWKWEPGFAQAAPGAPDGVATFWNLLNFDASTASENNNQFCFPPNNTSIYAFQHPTHADFLDLLWNNGVNPIYVWIGVSLPLQLVDPNVPEPCTSSVVCKADFRQFYRYTAKWLAKKYGNHPAVMGFVVGNELDTPGTTPTSEFWQTINDIGAVIKASAPDKLTAFTFHDTDDYNREILDSPFMNLRGPQVYGLDVYGFNPYTNPLPPGNLFDRFRTNVVENCTQTGTHNPCVKPLMYGEFGTPADMHKAVAGKPYPLQWVAQNFIWKPITPTPSCLASGAQPPPGGGGDGPAAEAASGATIAEELPSGAYYAMPATLAPFFSGSKAGDALPAAAQADWIAYFLDVSSAKKANNAAPPADLEFNSGGFMFEWRDEWWKANPVPSFHSVTGDQTCMSCTNSGPTPINCDTGAANVVFPGGWGDEEWFGAVGAVAKGRANTDPVVNSDGVLNGGPDTLTPRAALVALCRAYLSPKTCD